MLLIKCIEKFLNDSVAINDFCEQINQANLTKKEKKEIQSNIRKFKEKDYLKVLASLLIYIYNDNDEAVQFAEAEAYLLIMKIGTELLK